MEHTEKVRLTLEKYPTLRELKLAVLKGEYNDESPVFSRSLLWRCVCLNTYKLEFLENELKPVPEIQAKALDSDPLSSDQRKEHDGDVDILDVIKMDVERLILDPVFAQEEVKQEIIEILYNYHQFTPYKQGFHEIVGLIYLQLYKDTPHSSRIKLEAFNIFTSIMISVVPNFYHEDSLINWCTAIFNRYLRLIDPGLYELLIKRYKIESQVWLIRWLRLLFLREIGTENTTRLLDYLLCFDYDLCKLFPFIIVILLIKIKLKLVECEDNGEILYLLLHYPHSHWSNTDVKELGDLSLKLFKSPEDKMEQLGVSLTKKFFNTEFKLNWDKLKDLDRLKMEIKLQRRVKRALQKAASTK